MNNKEFITALAARLDMPAQDAQKVLATFVNEFTDVLGEGCSLTVSGFGCFEVKKNLSASWSTLRRSNVCLCPLNWHFHSSQVTY